MVVAAVVLFLVGLLLVREGIKPVGESTVKSVGESTAADPVSAADVGHIHGIGVNPADGQVYAGAHRGVIQLSEQEPSVLVSHQVQGYDGFIVVGPNHFLASGHPRLQPWTFNGLIESTDAGATWTTRSLEGRADFHTLQARHGLVYGYDFSTGDFMVTADLEEWETRSTVAIADFAVSPADPDLIVGVTSRGLVRSHDGGRSFTAPAGPVFQWISWADDGTLVGLTPKGVVHVSGDAGRSWDSRGTVHGTPEALEAVSAREIYAGADGAGLVSRDGGQTFAVLAP